MQIRTNSAPHRYIFSFPDDIIVVKVFENQGAYLVRGSRHFYNINMVNKKTEKKIVIYGGAFNPPHIGHAAAIENIIRLFPCDEVWVMPSADRHDKAISVNGEHRLKMLQIMIDKAFPDPQIPIIVSDMEVRRGISTTTFETKEQLEKQYPSYEFYFQVGTDIAGDIKDKWFKGADLFNSANFIVVKRSGAQLPKNIPKKSILLMDKQVADIDVSSSFVRRLLTRGYSGMPYITRSVAEYIKENKLYK